MDARLIKQMIDNDIDYFSSWGMCSNGAFDGLPSVSFHVAQHYYKMSQMNRLAVKRRGFVFQTYDKNLKKEKDISAVAGISQNGESIRVMAYNFKNALSYSADRTAHLVVNAPQLSGQTVKVTCWVVDDDTNYFDEWQADRIKYGITDDCFIWSPDDPAIESASTLSAQWARELYFSQLRDTYKECSKLTSVETTAQFSGDKLTLDFALGANTVVFYEITSVN